MNINLGKFRKRNDARKGQAKRDVDTLIDLVERLHFALFHQGHHTDACFHRQRFHRDNSDCICGLTLLLEEQGVIFDYSAYLRRKQILLGYFPSVLEAPSLREIYEVVG